MSDLPETVLITVHACEKSDPVYHIPEADGTPRCVCDADETYVPVGRADLEDRFRLCRTCDPNTHVDSGSEAVCDLLADLDPDELGRGGHA